MLGDDTRSWQQQLHDLMERRKAASDSCSEVSAQIVSLEAELAAMTQKKLELQRNKEAVQRQLVREEARNDLLCLGWNAKVVFQDLQTQFQRRLSEKEEQYQRSAQSLAEMTAKHAELQASVRTLQQQISPVEEQMKQLIRDQLARIREMEEELSRWQRRCTLVH